MDYAPLRLKKNEERRLRQGHLWVYSNEVDTQATPLSDFEAGQAVRIEAHNGKAVGVGYINPHSLICARLLSREGNMGVDRSLLVHRLKVALSLRERLFEQPYYRLVHGEGDALPGLVVDRYGDVVVAQLNTAGMEALKEEVVSALEKVLRPSTIILRNDASARKAEGLDSYVECALGEAPESVEIIENGARFRVPMIGGDSGGGQKTGWFYDHRDNRARMQHYVRDARVLDVFSYIGGWGIAAGVAGAAQVTCIDASAPALDALEANAELNGLGDKVDTIQGDAFEALKALRAEGERFDVVITDPPAFIKRRKDQKAGLEAYRRLNQAAMQLLGKDGILVSASCSHHLARDAHHDLLNRAARHLDRRLQLLEQGHQAADHPVIPVIPETDYIKSALCRVVAD